MNEKYNVLIIGAGNIGALFDRPFSKNILSHAHAFTEKEEFNLLGFVDSDIEKAKIASKIWNVNSYKDIKSAFKSNKIDVVSVCVPDEHHYKILKELAEFPVKLIFAEKPLVKNLQQAKEINNLYKSKNIQCLLNYSRRFVCEFKELRNKILSGEYGKFICGNGYYGKGILHNGSHLIDFLRYIIGEIKETQTLSYNFDFYQDDPSISCIVNFQENGSVSIAYLPCGNYTIFELDLLFEKKRIRILDSGFKIEIYQVVSNEMFKGYRNLIKQTEYETSLANALEKATENIANYFELNEELSCTLEDAYKVIEICEKLKDGIRNE